MSKSNPKKSKQSPKEVRCTEAVTKKHEPKGERKLSKSGGMTPSPRTPVHSFKGAIAFCSYASQESRGPARHRRKGHVGICSHHGSAGTASRHQEHLHSQLPLPPCNHGQPQFSLPTVSHPATGEQSKTPPLTPELMACSPQLLHCLRYTRIHLVGEKNYLHTLRPQHSPQEPGATIKSVLRAARESPLVCSYPFCNARAALPSPSPTHSVAEARRSRGQQSPRGLPVLRPKTPPPRPKHLGGPTTRSSRRPRAAARTTPGPLLPSAPLCYWRLRGRCHLQGAQRLQGNAASPTLLGHCGHWPLQGTPGPARGGGWSPGHTRGDGEKARCPRDSPSLGRPKWPPATRPSGPRGPPSPHSSGRW